MIPHDPKVKIMPAVILPQEGNTVEFSSTDAMRSQLLYSWLVFTGTDRMNLN
jgi:hypothetical protein